MTPKYEVQSGTYIDYNMANVGWGKVWGTIPTATKPTQSAVCPYCGDVADKRYIGRLCMSCHHGIMKEQV